MAAGPPVTFGEVLRRRRQHQGLSQRQLSRAIGRSPTYVTRLEAGAIDPSLSSVAALVVALQLSPLEVFVLVRLAVTPQEYPGSIDNTGDT